MKCCNGNCNQGRDCPARKPFWPFGQLTPAQMRERKEMEQKMQRDRLAKWPDALI